jgi:uncharacterized protein (TIGR03083 family)
VTRLVYPRYYVALPAEATRLGDALHDADLEAAVPTCPEWNLRELAAHVGRAHRWAEAIVDRRATSFVGPWELDDLAMPDADAPRTDWLRTGATRLVAAARAAGPDTAVWSWTDEQRVGFWVRRMTHETLVHRADADLALGRTFTVAADLAADGIREWLGLLSSDHLARLRPTLAALPGRGETLHLHATDAELDGTGEWMVHRSPVGVVWSPRHDRGDVTVTGRAADLLLLLLRRVGPDRPGLAVYGDEALLTHWLEHTAF